MSVDTTWGTLQPMQLADGVRTVGELEVIDHLEAGRPAVDSQLAEHHAVLTLPGAVNIPHPEASARLGEPDPVTPTVFFCTGPQCGQSPMAIGALLGGRAPRWDDLALPGPPRLDDPRPADGHAGRPPRPSRVTTADSAGSAVGP